jgi:hypothetical protein
MQRETRIIQPIFKGDVISDLKKAIKAVSINPEAIKGYKKSQSYLEL